MLDDWAYRDHLVSDYAVPPESPRQKSTKTRSNSILQSVARTKVSHHDLPLADLRPRANSDVKPKQALDRKIGNSPPWSAQERLRLYDIETFCGKSNMPPLFSEEIFSASCLDEENCLETIEAYIWACDELIEKSDNHIEESKVIGARLVDICDSMNTLSMVGSGGMSLKNDLNGKILEIEGTLGRFDSLKDAVRTLHLLNMNTLPRDHANVVKLTQLLDEGMQFCKDHPHYRDIGRYLSKFQQCTKKLLTLCWGYCISKFNETVTIIKEKAASNEDDVSSQSTWALFKAQTKDCGDFINILKAHQTPDYSGFFLDVESQYYSTRKSLLSNFTNNLLSEAGASIEQEQFRQMLTQFKHMYYTERELALEIMGELSVNFVEFMCDLMEPLHNLMKRTIFREHDIATLRQIFVVLQASSNEESNNEWEQVTRQIVNDAQSRIVFLAEQQLATLSRVSPSMSDIKSGSFQSVDIAFSFLNSMSQLTNDKAFEDISHRFVHELVSSLQQVLTSKEVRCTAYEKNLFLYKQYSEIYQQFIEMDIKDAGQEEIDYSGLRNAFHALMHEGARKNLFSVDGIRSLVMSSMPQKVERYYNTLQHLQAHISSTVDEILRHTKRLLWTSLDDDINNILDDGCKIRAAAELKVVSDKINEYLTATDSVTLLELISEGLVADYNDAFQSHMDTTLQENVKIQMSPDSYSLWLNSLLAPITK